MASAEYGGEAQRLGALARANVIRSERRRVKQRLHDGEMTLAEAMRLENLQSMEVRKLLLCLPGVGRWRLHHWMSTADIGESWRVVNVPSGARGILCAIVDAHLKANEWSTKR